MAMSRRAGPDAKPPRGLAPETQLALGDCDDKNAYVSLYFSVLCDASYTFFHRCIPKTLMRDLPLSVLAERFTLSSAANFVTDPRSLSSFSGTAAPLGPSNLTKTGGVGYAACGAAVHDTRDGGEKHATARLL